MRPPAVWVRIWAVVTLAAAIWPQAAAQPAVADATGPTVADSPAAMAELALDRFDAGVGLLASDPQAARAEFLASAAAYERLRGLGLSDSALEFNLGNAYFRGGDLGRAILAYRRAERLAPQDARIQANLTLARERVQPYIAAGGESQLAQRLFFWHYRTAAATRYRVALAAGLVGWALLTVRLRWRTTPLLIGGLAGVALSVANGASLLIEHRTAVRTPPAVVVGEPQVLRRGRGEGYEPVFVQPLGAGVELRVLQQRGDWVEVRLADENTGWLPVAAVDRS